MKFPRLLAAEPLPDFRLKVRFQDDTETIIDFNDQLSLPVMLSIATPEAFARVRLAETGSYLYWDVSVPPTEQPDASSDWLYLQRFSFEQRKAFEECLESGEDWNTAAALLLQSVTVKNPL
ncbi:MAG: DUF2442 domain-containing protein [Candidatus Kapabacteria bacterium]|jgi:hypothetical protein|nr:DUF2442 domain-containing protein [Candidatus Kapabacteria bacterium]